MATGSTISEMVVEEPKLESIQLTATYSQPADSMSTDIQFLEIKTEDAGGGMYYVISTERWAVDDLDNIIDILKHFKKKVEKLS